MADKPPPHDPEQRRSAAAKAVIDSHGYAFHDAVVHHCRTIRAVTGFAFEVSEFPVEVNGVHTRIDIVLKCQNVVVVIECKRVNPALSTWVFLRSDYRSSLTSGQEINVESMYREPTTGRLFVKRLEFPRDAAGLQFHHGFELKEQAKGDPHGHGRGAIEEAATQVFRGVNGLLNAMQHSKIGDDDSIVVPMIVTTANLYTSALDLSSTDIATGMAPPPDLQPQQCLWYEYVLSSHLRHALPKDVQNEAKGSLAGIKLAGHTRSVVITQPDAILSCLKMIAGLASMAERH